jgi:hypothetical protein
MRLLLEVVPVLMPLTAPEFPQGAIDSRKLAQLHVGDVYEIRLVNRAQRGVMESSNFYPTYQGTLLKVSPEGVLMAASHRSGCEMSRTRVVLPVPYLGIMSFVRDSNVGVGQESLRGKQVWIPVDQIVMTYGAEK